MAMYAQVLETILRLRQVQYRRTVGTLSKAQWLALPLLNAFRVAVYRAVCKAMLIACQRTQACLATQLIPEERIQAARHVLQRMEAKVQNGKPISLEEAKKLFEALKGADTRTRMIACKPPPEANSKQLGFASS